MSTMLNWWLARLREPSSWRGIVWVLTAAGVSLSPESWQYITTMGMAAAGLIGVLSREAEKTVNIQLPPIELVGKSTAGWTDAQPGPGPVRTDPVADQLRRPVRAVHNTDEAADSNNSPGFNG